MRQAVSDGFYDWSKQYEGAVNSCYQDVKGLVSIGVGILADPVGLMLSLPLRWKDGTLATPGDIRAEYERIKALGKGTIADGNPAAMGGWTYAKPYCNLHLDDAGMHYVVERKLSEMETILKRRYPNWDAYPADAQLGVMSYSWAMGPTYQFPAPKFARAVLTSQWLTASNECHLQESGNPGVKPRNAAMDLLFRNASVVEAQQMDPDVLYFPRDLESEPPDAA